MREREREREGHVEAGDVVAGRGKEGPKKEKKEGGRGKAVGSKSQNHFHCLLPLLLFSFL